MDTNTAPCFPLIQVAGVHDLAEARLLLNAGVDLIGIPLRLPVNAVDLTEPTARDISRALPGRCCLITYLSEASEVIEFAEFLGVGIVQLHGHISEDALKEIRRRRPGLFLIKSLVVGKDTEAVLLDRAACLSKWVDAFITDTWDPDSGAEGATGKVHDWSVSRRLCSASSRPVIMAGGLHPGNVAEAICATGCKGVDAHTAVEGPDGRKCAQLTSRFVEAARTEFGRAPSD